MQISENIVSHNIDIITVFNVSEMFYISSQNNIKTSVLRWVGARPHSRPLILHLDHKKDQITIMA